MTDELEAIRERHAEWERIGFIKAGPAAAIDAHNDRATLIRAYEEASRALAALSGEAAAGWVLMETAPKDGTQIQVRHEDGTEEDDVYWSDERYCILGRPQGSCGPGWVSTEAGNLPIDPPVYWRPAPAPSVSGLTEEERAEIGAIRAKIEETGVLLAAGASLRAVHAEALYKVSRTLLTYAEALLPPAPAETETLAN